MTEYDVETHLDCVCPQCPAWKGQIVKYDFQRASKILCLEAADNPLSLSILESVGSSVKNAGKWLSLKFTY